MSTELSGMLVLNQISEDDGATWKTIICETDSTITGGSATTERKTKCGTFTTTTNNATTVTGNGEARGDLLTGEMSYMRLQQLRDAGTQVVFRRQNSASGSIAAGEITYALFDAKITEVTETSSAEDVVKFTWSVSSTGNVDWDVAS